MNKQDKAKDQFFTNPKISDKLIEILFNIFPSSNDSFFIEPSAGSGNFVDSLIKKGISIRRIKAFDIDKRREFVIEANYLAENIKFKKNRITIGNPPFGQKASLAIQFLNKSLKESSIVAFIMPRTLNRYSAQKQVNKDAKLIFSMDLDEDSFLVDSRVYGVKTVFQIWVHEKVGVYAKDIRLKSPPPIRHADFETWIYNNTKETKKYFDKKRYGWDFAIHRQGFYEYNKLITDEKTLNPKRQYIFIKLKNKENKKYIKMIDFNELSKRNTQVLGFSTYDLVEAYTNIKEHND